MVGHSGYAVRRQSNESGHLPSRTLPLEQPTTSTSTSLEPPPNHHRIMPVPTDTTATRSPTRKSLYEGSTQYKHWRFSPNSLAAQRASQNKEAVAKIRDAFELDAVSSLLDSIVPTPDLDVKILARLVFIDRIFVRRRRTNTCQTLCLESGTTMCSFQVP